MITVDILGKLVENCRSPLESCVLGLWFYTIYIVGRYMRIMIILIISVPAAHYSVSSGKLNNVSAGYTLYFKLHYMWPTPQSFGWFWPIMKYRSKTIYCNLILCNHWQPHSNEKILRFSRCNKSLCDLDLNNNIIKGYKIGDKRPYDSRRICTLAPGIYYNIIVIYYISCRCILVYSYYCVQVHGWLAVAPVAM